ncbi:hypothetical protein MHU86_17613 [Fragilaria crotonensis]|nr:hypothetical protein MHU86_19334 [Fragilaria crotonensis]KAI2496866.1 hypothetical protein MHU86_17613 [Fragilaria crotonensis]
MALQRFRFFRRRNPNENANQDSSGENLEVQEACPHKSSKAPRGDVSISNISSITSNTESSETLASLHTAATENAAKGKERVNMQKGPWVTDSFAKTICNGVFDRNQCAQDNSIVAGPNEQAESSSFTTKIWSLLPSCFTPHNDEIVVATAETDDRSDVALHILSDIDTIEPVDDDNEDAKATQERSEQSKTFESKRSRSFLSFRRRNRSNGNIFV